MSVLKCASSLRLNPFATYVKERLSPSTEDTVTECYGLLSLSANSMVQHTVYRWMAKPPNFTAGAGQELNSDVCSKK